MWKETIQSENEMNFQEITVAEFILQVSIVFESTE